MHITTSFGGPTIRSSKRRLGAVAAAIALTATGAAAVVGNPISASDEGGGGSPPPPGEQVADVDTGPVFDIASGEDELIVTGGSTFDEAILTKYISAHGFQVLQGGVATGGGINDDAVSNGQTCVSPASDSGGTLTQMFAPVELPDGARIKRIHFYGQDDSAEDIIVSLRSEDFDTPFVFFPATPTSSRDQRLVDSFSTSGAQADATVFSGTDELEEIVGSFAASGGGAITSSTNRFHTIEVRMENVAAFDHVLCGVRVDYQVPVSSADPGTVFHAIEPARAFDSRLGSFAESGLLAPNTSKVIDITDGYDLNGVALPGQADVVPADATAISYNITVAGQTGPNFTSVTAGDAAAFTTSAINFGPTGDAANGSTVTISNGEIKLWGGDGAGSVHVIIDVTGYYAPAPPPSNMGN